MEKKKIWFYAASRKSVLSAVEGFNRGEQMVIDSIHPVLAGRAFFLRWNIRLSLFTFRRTPPDYTQAADGLLPNAPALAVVGGPAVLTAAMMCETASSPSEQSDEIISESLRADGGCECDQFEFPCWDEDAVRVTA